MEVRGQIEEVKDLSGSALKGSYLCNLTSNL
jgi:hypothetical protein